MIGDLAERLVLRRNKRHICVNGVIIKTIFGAWMVESYE
jgi:hypothetical protein